MFGIIVLGMKKIFVKIIKLKMLYFVTQGRKYHPKDF